MGYSRHFRKTPRGTVIIPVRFARGEGSSYLRKTGYIVDVGLGGAYVETDQPPPIGERIVLEFKSPSAWDPMMIGGEVRWIARNETGRIEGFGMDFTGLDSRQAHAIEQLVQAVGYIDAETMPPPSS